MNEFQEKQNEQLEGLHFNVTKQTFAFKKVRFYLDTAASKTDILKTSYYRAPFKSFWVVDTNNDGFVASMVINPDGDKGDALPLKPNMSIPFDYKQAGCCLEYASQPGVWVDIVFALDSNILPGFSNFKASSSSSKNEGDTFTNTNPTIADTGLSILVPSSTTRKKAEIQNKSGQPIWVGASAALSASDYDKKCRKVDHGYSYEWFNRGALYARVVSGTTDSVSVCVME